MNQQWSADGFPDLEKCWEWRFAKTSRGYGHMGISNKVHIVSRISYQLFYGKSPLNLNVCHRCDNPKCFNPAHLFLGTQKENLEDMSKKGRRRNGASYGRYKFSEETINNLRADFSNGASPKELIAKYGMTRDYVYKITRQKMRSDRDSNALHGKAGA